MVIVLVAQQGRRFGQVGLGLECGGQVLLRIHIVVPQHGGVAQPQQHLGIVGRDGAGGCMNWPITGGKPRAITAMRWALTRSNWTPATG
jgi:hypothetical protein